VDCYRWNGDLEGIERPDFRAGETVAAGAQIQSNSLLELLWILADAVHARSWNGTCFLNKVIYRNSKTHFDRRPVPPPPLFHPPE